MTADNDDVGYCKPPKRSRFKPGVSGNPRGRPKGAWSLRDELQRELRMKVTVTENGKTVVVLRQTALLKRLVAEALSGKAWAMKLALDLRVRLLDIPQEVDLSLSDRDLEILQQFAPDLLKDVEPNGGSDA
ncbi:MAG: DUF5681 domain-containing protein [Hyphomicrobiales bacterium]